MASSVNPITGSGSLTGAETATQTSAAGAVPNKELFLQLLVAQIKNQDPLNPTDSVQFVSQLAQFSELEQVIAIRGDLDAQQSAATNANAAPASQTTTA